VVGVCLILFLVLIGHGRKTISLLSDLAYSGSSLEKIALSARRGTPEAPADISLAKTAFHLTATAGKNLCNQ
jgi:hypothetical protein